MSAMASKIAGNESKMSVTRIVSTSNAPRKYPARSPNVPPTRVANKIEAPATNNDVRPP